MCCVLRAFYLPRYHQRLGNYQAKTKVRQQLECVMHFLSAKGAMISQPSPTGWVWVMVGIAP